MAKANVKSRTKKTHIRTHLHLTLSKTGYRPTGTNTAVNIKLAKRGR